MWNMKCKIISLIIGATGVVTKGLKKSLEAVLGKHSIDSVQKTVILGTSHIRGQFQNQPPIGWLIKYKIENKTLLCGTVTYITALLLHIVAIHI
jgi:hypothetical protein